MSCLECLETEEHGNKREKTAINVEIKVYKHSKGEKRQTVKNP